MKDVDNILIWDFKLNEIIFDLLIEITSAPTGAFMPAMRGHKGWEVTLLINMIIPILCYIEKVFRFS